MSTLMQGSQPKEYDAKFDIYIGGDWACYIKQELANWAKTKEHKEVLLTEACILFWKDYFKIVNRKQKQPMKDFLRLYFTTFVQDKRADYGSMMGSVNAVTESKLNYFQRKAYNSYIKNGGVLPENLQSKPIKQPDEEYHFYVLQASGGEQWKSRLHTSLKNELIILSRLPVLMMHHVDKQLDDAQAEVLYYRVLSEIC
jgi:hypothetical protein